MSIPIKVLVIEDDSYLSEIYTTFFEHEDVSTLALSGDEDVVGECIKFQPDLLLLDLNLKDITGFDVIRKLKLDPRTSDVPVIFISSENNPEVIAHSYFLGGVEYIQKTPDILCIVKHIKTMALLENMTTGLRRVKELLEAM